MLTLKPTSKPRRDVLFSECGCCTEPDHQCLSSPAAIQMGENLSFAGLQQLCTESKSQSSDGRRAEIGSAEHRYRKPLARLFLL